MRRVANHSGEVLYVPEFEGNRADSTPVRVTYRPPTAWQRDELSAAAVVRGPDGKTQPRPGSPWAREIVRTCVVRVENYERLDQATGRVEPIQAGEDLATFGESGLVQEAALTIWRHGQGLDADAGNVSGDSSASERQATSPRTTAAPAASRASNGSAGAALAP